MGEREEEEVEPRKGWGLQDLGFIPALMEPVGASEQHGLTHIFKACVCREAGAAAGWWAEQAAAAS